MKPKAQKQAESAAITADMVARFEDKYIPVPHAGCWLWTAATSNGYGIFTIRKPRLVKAHRFSYELHVGPVPDGLFLDHLCRTRCCVNPYHLEPVTQRENLLRGETVTARNAAKTHCVHGHRYTKENTIPIKGKWRACRTCVRTGERRRYEERRRSSR